MTPKLIARAGFALLVALPVYARAETDQVPPPPDRNPAQLDAPAAEKPVLPGDAPTVTWTDEEIAAAKADCAKALANLALDYEPLPPIKEGMCGAPAPILLKALGSDPKVEIDPPATVTCARSPPASAPGSARPCSPRRARCSAPRGQAAQRHLLCVPQSLRRRDHAAERACACQRARCLGVRVRLGGAHHRARRLAAAGGHAAPPLPTPPASPT